MGPTPQHRVSLHFCEVLTRMLSCNTLTFCSRRTLCSVQMTPFGLPFWTPCRCYVDPGLYFCWPTSRGVCLYFSCSAT